MTGSMVHFEIKVKDMARAKKFYSAFLGWKFEQLMPGYAMIRGPKGVSGALDRVKTVSGKSATVPYFEVKSVGKALTQAKQLKAKTVVPETSLGSMGVMARIKDSEGNIIGIWSKK